MPMWIVSRGVVLILALVEVLRVLRGFLLGTFFQSSTVASLSNKIWGILLIFSLVIVGFTSPSGHSNSRQNTRLIVAYDKNFSCIWAYTSMMLPRVRKQSGGISYFDTLMLSGQLLGGSSLYYFTFKLFGIIISVVVIQDGDEVACDDEYCLKKKTWSIA
ncbi:hypothetical protein Tco_0967138 [Tanacetum coccineum]